MIDLSKFVNKQVRVTFRDGSVEEGFVKSILHYDYPFSINLNQYSNNGEWKYSKHHSYDIIQIEEIKPMNRYEELEKQVAEMQKVIDRLKREEKKYPDLKPMKVTRTVIYTPEEYFEHCKDWEEEPTQDGFREYVSCWKRNADCFVDSGQYTQEIKVVEN